MRKWGFFRCCEILTFRHVMRRYAGGIHGINFMGHLKRPMPSRVDNMAARQRHFFPLTINHHIIAMGGFHGGLKPALIGDNSPSIFSFGFKLRHITMAIHHPC